MVRVALKHVGQLVEVKEAGVASVVHDTRETSVAEPWRDVEDRAGGAGERHGQLAVEVLGSKRPAAVDLDAGAVAVRGPDGDSERQLPALLESPERGGRAVTQNGVAAAGQDGGERAGERCAVHVADRVDGGLDGGEPARRGPA